MKKLKYVMTLLLTIIILMVISTNVNAIADTIEIKQIIIESEKTEYSTGDILTIALKSEQPITLEKVPSLVIQFGTGAERIVNSITTNGSNTDTWKYNYTIQSSDIGALKVLRQKQLKDNGEESGYVDTYITGITLSKQVTANNGTSTVPPTQEDDKLTWADTSKLEIKITRDEYNNSYGYLNITGLDLEREYYIYVSNGKVKPTVPETGWIENANFYHNGYENKMNYNINKYLEKNGDIYVWIYESQSTEGKRVNKCIVEGEKVARPSQNKLGYRMNCYFFDDTTDTFLWEPYDYGVSNRNIKLKIGKVTDTSILRSIKNGETDCLSKLLTYAKSADSIYTGSVPLGNSATITNNINIVDDEYYYVYMVLDDENGKYYPVEDVSLYQGLVSESAGKNLFDYLDDNFKWNLSDEDTVTEPDKTPTTPKDDSTIAPGKLPQTGVSTFIIISTIVISICITVVIAAKYKKYNIKF